MKKLAAFALAGLFALSCATVSFAEEEISVLDSSMMDEAAFEGSWITAFDTFNVYLPNEWIIVSNGDEGEAPSEDTMFFCQSEDAARNFYIDYVGEAEEDINELAGEFEEDGAGAVEIVELNGMPAVTYVLDEDVFVTGFVVVTDTNEMYNVYFNASEDDEEFNEIGLNIALSFSQA